MIAPALRDTLVGLAGRLAVAGDPWWIITGAAVALHGGTTPVADVDLLVSERDARLLLGEGGAPGAPSGRYRSARFGTIDGLPLPVEVMAEFELFDQGRWRPVRFATREPVAVGPATLFVPGRRELAALLAAIGRPKDLERVVMLTS